MLNKYVYRLLHESDHPHLGITAKDPSANEEVEEHVGHGSKAGFESQFISTTANYDSVYDFAQLTYKSFIRVVKIDLEKLKIMESDIEVIDLTDEEVRDEHIKFQRADTFAQQFDEVLLIGYIPSSCIKLIYAGPKKQMPINEPDTASESSESGSDESDDEGMCGFLCDEFGHKMVFHD